MQSGAAPAPASHCMTWLTRIEPIASHWMSLTLKAVTIFFARGSGAISSPIFRSMMPALSNSTISSVNVLKARPLWLSVSR